MSRTKLSIFYITICCNFFTRALFIPINNTISNDKKLSNNNGIKFINIRSTPIPSLHGNYQLSEPEVRKPRRVGKFFTSLPFLTGLGVGTLATSSAIANNNALQSSNSMASTRIPRPIPASLIDSHTGLNLGSTIPQRAVLPNPHHYMNVYDSSYPHHLAFSTTLLDQSLRSIYHALENLRSQLNKNNTLNHVSTTTEKLITPTTEESVSTENIEEVNEGEATANVEIINARDTREIFNCSILQDVIRESIKQVNLDLEQRQAEQMQQTTLPPVIEMTTEPVSPSTTEEISNDSPLPPIITTTTTAATTTTTSTTTAAPTTTIIPMPIPQLNTTGNFLGNYEGNPQNINGIDLSTSSNVIYDPPVYDHGEFRPIYYPFPNDADIEYLVDPTFGNSYPHDFPETWPTYSPYARSRKYSKEMKTLDRKNDFIPSNGFKLG